MEAYIQLHDREYVRENSEFVSIFWICWPRWPARTYTKRNVGELEIYALSKFQPCTTLGGRKNVENLTENEKMVNFGRPFTPETWPRSA